jgi:hypothetical protein
MEDRNPLADRESCPLLLIFFWFFCKNRKSGEAEIHLGYLVEAVSQQASGCRGEQVSCFQFILAVVSIFPENCSLGNPFRRCRL